MNGRGLTALVIAITIGAVFFVPVADVVQSNTGEVDVLNETLTESAEYDVAYELTGHDIEVDSETIEYDDGTGWATATEGTDYTIDYDNETVTILSGGEISEGDEVRASYTYQATDGTTSTVAGLIPVLLALLLLVPLANKVQEGVQ